MSASSKKKLRKEQKAVNLTERQKAAKKEEKQLKIYTATFWIILALCVCLVAGIVLRTPINTLAKKVTTAVVVGDHKLSNVELNYFYVDAINEYCNQYSQYLSYFLDTSKSLDEQEYDKESGMTWADYFVEMAIDKAQNTYALYDAAIAAGHELTEDEQASVDELYKSMEPTSKQNGFNSVNAYLQAFYGSGASEKSYCDYYEVTVLASSYYTKYVEDLENSYEDSDLRDFEKEKLYEYNSYTYLSHYLSVDDYKMGGTKGEDDKITYSDEEIAAAEKAVKEAAEKLAVADNNTAEKLNAAIEVIEKELAEAKKAAEDAADDKTEDTTEDKTEGTTEDKTEDKTEDTAEGEKEETVKYSTCTENEDVLYSSVNSVIQEWLRDEKRVEGDITFIENATTSEDEDGKETKTLKGYYVVVYQGVNDNTYSLADVRHILISYEGGKTDSNGNTTYTDAEKEAARKEAYDLLDEWFYGEKTEESFAELAEKHSTDSGSNTNGGLYEDVYPGQMVTAFNDWCFADNRKAGDNGVVQTDYGYHVMFYSGDSEMNYRDFMITADMLEKDVEEWQTELNEGISVTEKNTSFIDRDLVLNSGS